MKCKKCGCLGSHYCVMFGNRYVTRTLNPNLFKEVK